MESALIEGRPRTETKGNGFKHLNSYWPSAKRYDASNRGDQAPATSLVTTSGIPVGTTLKNLGSASDEVSARNHSPDYRPFSLSALLVAE